MLASDTAIDVRLTAIRYAAHDTNLYEFRRLDGGALPPTQAGAHIDVHLPNGIVRQYSLVEAEAEPYAYVVGVKRDPASRGGSSLIHERLRVGTTLAISAPRNNFPLVETAPHSILVAGGIGITPIHAMMRRLQAIGADWQLHFACRSRADAAFLDELARLPQVTFSFDDENGGRFLDFPGIVAAAPPGAHFYCCGPTPMLRAFEAATAGLATERVHVEYFAASSASAVEGGYVVALARAGREFAVPPGQTILGVLRDNGIDVSYSCEEGVCGACETRVLSGEPDHRDTILSATERAAGKTMMICCSGCKSDRLVLDI
jgi:ferredoxin-NADP reductase